MVYIYFSLAFMGFICLSMAMKRHFKQAWPQYKLDLTKVILLRLTGSALLIGSCLLSVKMDGVGIGLVSWLGILTFTALLQSLLLTYQPQLILQLFRVFKKTN